jgi:hypothetical protein
MSYKVTRPNPLERATRLIRNTSDWMLRPCLVEAAGVFGFPDYLLTMREVR